MSETFDKTLIAAADSFFQLPGAELVTYFPSGGISRRIKAVISRAGPENIPGVSGGSLPAFEVLVKNDSDEGIASDQLDTGGDKIECAKRVEQRPKMLRLTEIINHDAGLILLAAS
jgi:hypothetical protein